MHTFDLIIQPIEIYLSEILKCESKELTKGIFIWLLLVI